MSNTRRHTRSLSKKIINKKAELEKWIDLIASIPIKPSKRGAKKKQGHEKNFFCRQLAVKARKKTKESIRSFKALNQYFKRRELNVFFYKANGFYYLTDITSTRKHFLIRSIDGDIIFRKKLDCFQQISNKKEEIKEEESESSLEDSQGRIERTETREINPKQDQASEKTTETVEFNLEDYTDYFTKIQSDLDYGLYEEFNLNDSLLNLDQYLDQQIMTLEQETGKKESESFEYSKNYRSYGLFGKSVDQNKMKEIQKIAQEQSAEEQNLSADSKSIGHKYK